MIILSSSVSLRRDLTDKDGKGVRRVDAHGRDGFLGRTACNKETQLSCSVLSPWTTHCDASHASGLDANASQSCHLRSADAHSKTGGARCRVSKNHVERFSGIRAGRIRHVKTADQGGETRAHLRAILLNTQGPHRVPRPRRGGGTGASEQQRRERYPRYELYPLSKWSRVAHCSHASHGLSRGPMVNRRIGNGCRSSRYQPGTVIFTPPCRATNVARITRATAAPDDGASEGDGGRWTRASRPLRPRRECRRGYDVSRRGWPSRV